MRSGKASLFLSEAYQPLTSNAITLLCDRLKKRAGISDKPVSPSVLRDTFAVRYLQAGGTLEALRDLLGLRDLEALKRYVRAAQADDREGPAKVPAQGHLARREACSANKQATAEKTVFGDPQTTCAAPCWRT